MRVAQAVGVVGIIAAIAVVPALIGGNRHQSGVSNNDEVVEPVIPLDESSARLLELPFEPGTIVQVGERLYVTAGSSSNMDEPGQVYYSDDIGETWEPLLDNPSGMRFGRVETLGDVMFANGLFEYVPEDPPDPFDEDGGLMASPWTVVVDGRTVTQLHGDETFESAGIAASDLGLLALVLDGRTGECQILRSVDGIDWSGIAPLCPSGMLGMERAGEYVLGLGESNRLWLLQDGTFNPVDLEVQALSGLLDVDQKGLYLSRPVADGSGQVLLYDRQTQMIGETAKVRNQRIFAARSFDGLNWELETLDTEGEVFPYGITGLDSGFIAIVRGDVVRSDDGVNWRATGQSLGADVWSTQAGVVVNGQLLVPVGPAAQSTDPGRPRQLATVDLD